jgi:hypothetical protein
MRNAYRVLIRNLEEKRPGAGPWDELRMRFDGEYSRNINPENQGTDSQGKPSHHQERKGFPP